MKYNYIKNTFQVEAFPSNSKVADMQMSSETLSVDEVSGCKSNIYFS